MVYKVIIFIRLCFYFICNFILFYFIYGKKVNIKTKIKNIKGIIYISPKANVFIDKGVKINSSKYFNVIGGPTKMNLITKGSGCIEIGKNTGISNSTIVAHTKVVISDNVKIGGGVKIYDTDFHSLDFLKRRTMTTDIPNTAPIYICNDVFIGAGSTILKGVRVGSGTIIGANSVLTKSTGENEVWCGNPAKKIKDLN